MSGSWARNTGLGILWSAGTFVVGRLLAFATLLVLARLLTPSEFGVVAAITVFLTIIEMVSDLGMKAVVVYEQEEGVTRRVQTAFTVNLIFAAVLTVLAFLAAPLVAGFFHSEAHTDLYRLASLNLLLSALGNIHDGMLLRDVDFRRRSRPELVRGVARGAVGIALAATGFGAASLVWSLLAGSAARGVALWAMVPLRPSLTLDWGILRTMRSYAAAASAHMLLSEIARAADAGAIGRILGERALGIYTVAMRVPELAIRTVSWNLSMVLFPALSQRRATDAQSLGKAALELTRLQALYILSVAACLATLATPLVIVLFSSTWESAGPVMAVLACLAACEVITMPLGDAMRAVGQQRVLVWVSAIIVPAQVAAVIVAAPQGIVAVAWSLLGVQSAFAALVCLAAGRTIGVSVTEISRALAPGVVAAAGTAAAAYAVHQAWNEASLPAVAAASLAGALGAVAALRLLAVSTYRDVRSAVASGLGSIR